MVKKRKTVKRKSHSARTKKTPPKRITRKTHITQSSSEVKVEKILIENFVSLQKVMTHLSLKFDNLAGQISKLLHLFEVSAKALAEKEFNLEKGDKDNKKIIEKLDNLSGQNKIIARGLTLLHEPEMPESIAPIQQPFPSNIPKSSQDTGMNKYQKSISARLPEKSLQPAPRISSPKPMTSETE